MLVYLATPYSHKDPIVCQARFEAVNKCAAVLISQGLHVFSPISHTHPIALASELPGGWQYWEQYDRAMLRCCDKLIVFMQDGWSVSIGVLAEIQIAKDLGLPVEYLEVL